MSRLRAALAFSAVVLRILGRDKAALFFIVVLPVVVIVIIGTTFGEQGRLELGLARAGDGPVAQRVEAALASQPGVKLRRYDDPVALAGDVRRQRLVAGVVVDDAVDEAVAAGGTGEVGLISNPASQGGLTARIAVQAAVDRAEAPLTAARLVVAETAVDAGRALATADGIARAGEPVRLESVGDGIAREPGRFALVAPQELVLFVFINAMAAAALIVSARRNGVLRRSFAAPAPAWVVLAGLGLGWLALSLVQSGLILAIGALLFDVDWGDPLAAALLVLAFALVGCGAGLLVGAIGRNEDRVSSITPILGIVLAALGGCMVPLEIFPPVMRAIAHVTPHYWAVDAWQRLVFDGAGVGGIAVSLGVLLAFAAVFLTIATTLLRRL